MLQLAKNYTPHQDTHSSIFDGHQLVSTYNAPETNSVEQVSVDKVNKKTKWYRLQLLLGKGDVAQGMDRLEKITKDLAKQFTDMYETLETQIEGKKVLELYMGKRVSYLSMKFRDIHVYGITTYKKLKSIHQVLKSYQKLQNLKLHKGEYIPIEKRLPLKKTFLRKYYWEQKLTTQMIADAIYVPEIYIQKEITRLDMGKRKHGIKLRGRKGYKMPEVEKIKHRNQPHARAVVQICPNTFKIIRHYHATGAVERDGWSRENVRKAIKTAGLHDGFLWAYKGDEESIISRAKEKGNLQKKLAIFNKGTISRDRVRELYIDKDMNYQEVAKELDCNWHTIACIASKMGLKKRNPVDTATLKRLYIDQGLQAKQIAQITGHTVKTISTYLSKRKITRRTT